MSALAVYKTEYLEYTIKNSAVHGRLSKLPC